jgi:hypothetical protein
VTPPKRKTPRDMTATKALKADVGRQFDLARGQATGAISLAYLRGEHAGVALAIRILRRKGNKKAADLLTEQTGYEC